MRTKERVIGLVIVGMSLMFAAQGAQASLVEDKLSVYVKTQINQGKQSMPIMIMLNKKAQLSPAAALATKEEKGRYVYNTLRANAQSSQAELVEILKDKKVAFEQFYIVNMIAVYDAPLDVINEIAARDDVAKIIGDPSYKIIPDRPDTDFFDLSPQGVEGGIVSTGAKKVWDEFNIRGENIVVAGQDTGVEWTHPALKKKYRGFDGATASHDYNWYDAIRKSIDGNSNPCGIAIAAPCDDSGHGTHTVGTIVGDDERGNQIGMAPKAKWIACRNMDNGTGRPTTYIKCFEFFLAPFPNKGTAMADGRPELAPHIINNSWGCPASEGCNGDEMRDVVVALKAAGIVTVVSAGNDGPRCSTIEAQPATISDDTLSVGAHNHANGNIASFSSRGPSKLDGGIGPDVTAPGVGIRSAVPGGRYQGGFTWSGTSMAGPHVAGEVALILAANPTLIGKVQDVFDLVSTATKPKTSTQTCGGVPGSQVPNNTFGHGIIDAYKAVTTARNMK